MSVNALIFTEMMTQYFPPCRPIGAYRIATEIRKAGYTCQVIDFFTKFDEDEMEKIITSFIGEDTLIVGFSSTFFEYIDEKLDALQTVITGKKTQPFGNQLLTVNYPYHRDKMRDWFQRMRKINPSLKIVYGGAKTRYLAANCDAYAVGYADQAIVEYMKYLEGKNPFFQFERLNNQIIINGATYTKDFDYCKSTVEWHETDHLMHGEAVPIEIARGCVFKCKFCSFPSNGKKKLDFIKEDSVLRDEFLRNYYEYGITRYIYADDTHNDSVEKVERLHKIVTSLPFELEYGTYLRHDLIHAHPETAILLKESGLRTCMFGIESLNHKSGKEIGKGLHPDKIKELMYWLKNDIWKNDVGISASFIVGLPYDTPTTVMEWATWLLDPSCPIDTFYIEPLFIAGSELRATGSYTESEFEKNTAAYGYSFIDDNICNWTNEHFTYASAMKLADRIKLMAYKKGRQRHAGFSLMMFSNLGFIPKDLIGNVAIPEFLSVPKLSKDYLNIYREKLLKQIDYNKII